MSENNENIRLVWGVGLIVLFVKLVMLIIYSPIHMPDSSGYTVYAENILTEQHILFKADWLASWGHSSTFRSIGYPLFLAFHKVIAGSYYDWGAVITQMAISLFATYLIYRLAFALLQKQYPALFCGIAYAFSQSLTLDQCILTDSLNASFLIITVCLCAIKILKSEQPTIPVLLGLGGLVTLSFLVREAGSFLQYLYWPLILYWLWSSSESKKRSTLLFICFIAPMILTTQLYKSWNEIRTGERFVTTAGRTTMFFPALNLKSQGIDAFASEEKLQDLPPYVYPLDQNAMANVGIINKHLIDNYDMTPIEISRFAFAKFFGYWVEYPVGMIKSTLSEIREKQVFMGFMPIEALMTLDFWQTGSKPFQKRRDLMAKVKNEGRSDLLVLYMLRHVERVVSIALSIAFVFGVPYLVITQSRQAKTIQRVLEPQIFLLVLFWLIYFGYTFAYAMVHMEQRYLLPVVPFSVVCGVIVLTTPVSAIWAKMFKRK